MINLENVDPDGLLDPLTDGPIRKGVFDRDLYTIRELCQVLGVDRRFIDGAIKTKQLKALYLGSTKAGYRIWRQDAIDWINKMRGDD